MTFDLNEEKRLMLESIQRTGDGFFYDRKGTGMALGADANRRSKYMKDKMQLGGEYDKADDQEYLLALAGPVKEEANNPEAVAQVHEGDPIAGEESDLGRMLNGEKLTPDEAKRIHMDVARDMLFDGGLGPWHHPMMGSEAEYARDADQPERPEKLPLSNMNKEFLQTASEEMLANALKLHKEQAANGDKMSAALVPILEKVLAGRFGQIKRSFDIDRTLSETFEKKWVPTAYEGGDHKTGLLQDTEDPSAVIALKALPKLMKEGKMPYMDDLTRALAYRLGLSEEQYDLLSSLPGASPSAQAAVQGVYDSDPLKKVNETLLDSDWEGVGEEGTDTMLDLDTIRPGSSRGHALTRYSDGTGGTEEDDRAKEEMYTKMQAENAAEAQQRFDRLMAKKGQGTEQVNRSFDINAAIASRDQTFTPEPIQRANTEAFQRMGRFGNRREKYAVAAPEPTEYQKLSGGQAIAKFVIDSLAPATDEEEATSETDEAAKPAEARLDQPDARDSSS